MKPVSTNNNNNIIISLRAAQLGHRASTEPHAPEEPEQLTLITVPTSTFLLFVCFCPHLCLLGGSRLIRDSGARLWPRLRLHLPGRDGRFFTGVGKKGDFNDVVLPQPRCWSRSLPGRRRRRRRSVQSLGRRRDDCVGGVNTQDDATHAGPELPPQWVPTGR